MEGEETRICHKTPQDQVLSSEFAPEGQRAGNKRHTGKRRKKEQGRGKERRQTWPIDKWQFIKVKEEIPSWNVVSNFDWAC